MRVMECPEFNFRKLKIHFPLRFRRLDVSLVNAYHVRRNMGRKEDENDAIHSL